MSKVSKFIVLFLALLLSCVSIKFNNSSQFSSAESQKKGDGTSASFSLENKLILFCLQRQNENTVNPATNFPPPVFRNHFNDYISHKLYFELKLINIALQYILNSKEIIRSLSIRDIIYPFQFFG